MLSRYENLNQHFFKTQALKDEFPVNHLNGGGDLFLLAGFKRGWLE